MDRTLRYLGVLKKIDATVSNVANTFNNLTNIIVKRNQEETNKDGTNTSSNQTLKKVDITNSSQIAVETKSAPAAQELTEKA